ncbi:MAG: IPTL-CTERM sorting domain-containing protein [Burkholderiaceae bacterium]
MHFDVAVRQLLNAGAALVLSLSLGGPALAQTVLNGLTFDSADGNHTHAPAGSAEVGGFGNVEIVRGMSEFDISSLGSTVTSASLRFTLSQLNGCCGQSPLDGTIEVVSYVGNNAADQADFNTPTSGTIGTFTTTGAVVGDIYTFDVTALVNAARSASNTSFGVRLARSPESGANEALTFSNFQLLLDAPVAAPRTVPTLSVMSLLALSGLIAGFAAVRMRRK